MIHCLEKFLYAIYFCVLCYFCRKFKGSNEKIPYQMREPACALININQFSMMEFICCLLSSHFSFSTTTQKKTTIKRLIKNGRILFMLHFFLHYKTYKASLDKGKTKHGKTIDVIRQHSMILDLFESTLVHRAIWFFAIRVGNKKVKRKKAALDRIPSTFTWRLTYTMHFSRKVCYLPFSPFSGFCHLYGIRAAAYKRHASKTIEAFSIWICLVI